MSYKKERTSVNNHNLHSLPAEVRLNRIHRLFKDQYNVTEPSLILEPYLFLGNCISAQDVHRLSKLGIRYILNVAIRDVEVCPYYGDDIRVHTIDLRDDDRENIIRIFDQAFRFIDEAKKSKSRVLVHCSHGQSRSPAIVIAYLMRTYDVSLEQCLIHVIKARPCVSPNDGFLKQLILFDRFLVDRQRKKEQAAAIATTAANSTTANSQVKEISIHHRRTSRTRENEARETSTKSDSEKTSSSTSSGSSSMNASSRSTNVEDSVHIVPIQTFDSQINTSKQMPSTEFKSIDRDKPEQDSSVRKLQSKNRSTFDVNMMISKDDLNLRSENHATIIVGRSKSAHPERSRPYLSYHQHNHYYDQASSELPDTTIRTEVPYYSINHRTDGAQQPKRTQYITEIYDRATNRYILAES